MGAIFWMLRKSSTATEPGTFDNILSLCVRISICGMLTSFVESLRASNSCAKTIPENINIKFNNIHFFIHLDFELQRLICCRRLNCEIRKSHLRNTKN